MVVVGGEQVHHLGVRVECLRVSALSSMQIQIQPSSDQLWYFVQIFLLSPDLGFFLKNSVVTNL
jgi:hypothetical protein